VCAAHLGSDLIQFPGDVSGQRYPIYTPPDYYGGGDQRRRVPEGCYKAYFALLGVLVLACVLYIWVNEIGNAVHGLGPFLAHPDLRVAGAVGAIALLGVLLVAAGYVRKRKRRALNPESAPESAPDMVGVGWGLGAGLATLAVLAPSVVLYTRLSTSPFRGWGPESHETMVAGALQAGINVLFLLGCFAASFVAVRLTRRMLIGIAVALICGFAFAVPIELAVELAVASGHGPILGPLLAVLGAVLLGAPTGGAVGVLGGVIAKVVT
jgi:hypothetical protein